MRKTGAGKNGQFLSADQRIQSVDRRDAGLNEFGGIISRRGIQRCTVDVQFLFGDDRGAAVDRSSHSVEYTSKHILRNSQFRSVSEETHLGAARLHALGAFKQLNDAAFPFQLQHFSQTRTLRRQDLNQLIIGGALYAVDDHQRADDFTDRLIFLAHRSVLRSAVPHIPYGPGL